MNKVEAKRIDLVNQGYSPFLIDALPSAESMKRIVEWDATIYWSLRFRRYIIFPHVKIIGPIKYRLTSIKKPNCFIP